MNLRLPLCSLLVATAGALAACATSSTASGLRADARAGQDRVDAAANVVDRMKAEPNTSALLARAKGVLVVPSYGKAAWIIGGQGGEGVLMVRHAGHWGDPAFYTLGGLSIGFQAGGEGGSVALVLMTDRAVQQFEDRTTRWSLGADAGLTVVNYSDKVPIVDTAAPVADVVFWSGTKGLFGGIAVGGTVITADTGMDNAYYHRVTTTREILTGSIADPHSDPLRVSLQTRVAAQ